MWVVGKSFCLQFPCLFGVAVDIGNSWVIVGVVFDLGRAFIEEIQVG